MRILTSVFLLFCCFSCASQSPELTAERFTSEMVATKLSAVIPTLLDQEVSGYVLINSNAFEYGSLEKARMDQSPAKSLVAFDVDRIDLAIPNTYEKPGDHMGGSPLICRKVVHDFGDVVSVMTLDVAYEVPEKLGHGGLGADYVYRLKTYVRKKDLVPVIGKTFEKYFEDSTGFRFDPGVAVGIPWNGDEHKRALSIQKMHFEFVVPDSIFLPPKTGGS